jgi:D-beta-D-heptose 7-phosphate kinase/D-beta-D-heptose 1-phosphate adenosyltransferase
MEGGFTKMKVWVNGTFDVLHIGHIRLLEFASKYGEVRVGIDTDERVKELKGESRPFNSVEDRKEFLSSIKFVNSVVSFGTDDELIEKIKEYDPEIMVIGEDYKSKRIIGAEFVPKVVFFKKVEYKSTSKILRHDKDISDR